MALVLALCLLPSAPALATAVDSAPLTAMSTTTNGMVRVYLSSLGNPSALTLTIAGSYTVNGDASQALTSGSQVTVGFNSSTGNLTLTRNGSTSSMGSYFAIRRHSAAGSNGVKIAQARQPSNPYPGDISFRAVRQSSGAYKLYTVAHVFMESYLYGVLPYEMGNSAGLEALKAQAVAARTYTMRMMNARSSGYYDVVDTTSDQVYNGTPSGNANCVAAIDATKGVVVMNGSSLTMTYYSASNGGQTESAKNLWGSSGYDYLTVKDDPFDLQNPACTVKRTTVYASCASAYQNASLMALLRTKAIAALNGKGYNANAGNTTLGTITGILPHTPKYASPSKLYTKLDFTLTASTPNSQGVSVSTTVTVTCDIFGELEKLLGMSIQSSSNELWSVSKSGGNFVLEARRYGHGIGMSQRGAMYMSKLGYTYDQILGFYYPGCKRVRHNLTNTILSAVGSGAVVDQTTVEEAAQVDETGGTSNAVVSLVSSSASLAIRADKSLTGQVLGTVASSAPVQVLSNDGSWCFIQYGNVRGYVPTSALSITGAVTGGAEQVSQILCYATVTGTGSLNLRSEGSYSGKILTSIASGSVLTVFSKASGWAHVQFGATVAYACTDYLTFSDSYPGALADSGSATATVTLENTNETVNLRATPSTSSAILAALPHGTQVVVTSDDGAWCAVTYNGQQGYIIKQYLTLTGSAPASGETTTQPTTDLSTGETLATAASDGGALQIWAQNSTDSAVLASVPNGASVVVTAKGDQWSAVRYEGVAGFAITMYLTFSAATGGSAQPTVATATVVTASGSLNMRSESRAGSQILTTIPRGATVSVNSRGATWCAVTYAGLSGYVMAQFLQFAGAAVTPEPSAGSTAQTTAVVTTASGSLNLRQLGKAGSKILRTIPQYATVTVYTRGADWCYVSYEGTTGYVMAVFLSFTSGTATQAPTLDAPTATPAPGATAAPATAATAIVNTASGSLNLRQEPVSGSAILGRIPQYASLTVLTRDDRWCYVQYGGLYGYVVTSYLLFTQAGATPTAVTPTTEATATPTPTQAVGAALTAWVATSSGSLNLRALPENGSQIVTTIPQYAVVTVTAKGDPWCAVSYNGYAGYVQSRFLAYPDAAQAAAQQTATAEPTVTAEPTQAPQPTAITVSAAGGQLILDPTLAVVQAATFAACTLPSGIPTLTMYSQCSEQSTPVTEIAGGERLTVMMTGDTWLMVQLDTFVGYCLRQYLVLQEN